MTRHAFLKSSVTASPSAIGKPYPQIVQDIFLSPFLFFLYIQYAGFCRQQNAAGRYICRASRPVYTPARLAAWTAPQNYVLLFSQHLPAGILKKPRHPTSSFRLQPVNTFPAGFLQSTTLSVRHHFHSGVSRQQPHAASSFHTSITILSQPITFIPA